MMWCCFQGCLLCGQEVQDGIQLRSLVTICRSGVSSKGKLIVR
jgi:hypothetical protein